MLIHITPAIALDDKEITMEFVRASGPGGQNVNKVATAVKLFFNAAHSPSLPDPVRQRLLRSAKNRINAEGILIIDARRFRTQEQNRRDALERLTKLIIAATFVPKPRRATRPTLTSQTKRIASKIKRGQIKQSRSYKDQE